jgi:hypothetical protein
MALGFTNKAAVAIIDTVRDEPIIGLRCFESADHAQDFLDWLAEKHEAGLATDRDPRKLTPRYRAGAQKRWWDERVDGETGQLRD